jgi:hypothetical protein
MIGELVSEESLRETNYGENTDVGFYVLIKMQHVISYLNM